MFTIEKRDRDLLMMIACLLAAFMLLAWIASPVYATQPECTGDRHYDSEANGCCPNVECPQSEECDVCKPVLPCPDPAPCQPVTCECANGTSQIVYVDRCPQPEVSEVCKVRRDGTVVCPRSKKARRHGNGARRILVPQSIIDQIADVAKY